jgi:hypothetical protein
VSQHGAIAEELLAKQMLYTLPFQVGREDEKELVRLVVEANEVIGAEAGATAPFWLGAGATHAPRIQREKMPGGSLAHLTEYQMGRLPYYLRLRDDIEWEWIQNPIGDLCRKILMPLSPIIKKITRVSILLQIPNMALPAHRDLVPGNTYKNMLDGYRTFWGPKTETYQGEEWLKTLPWPMDDGVHKRNRFLNLKIPISEMDQPGRPFLIWDSQKIVYDTQKRAFLLNEVEMEHGADPVPFHRGVIFVDSLLNFEAISQVSASPVHIQSCERVELQASGGFSI